MKASAKKSTQIKTVPEISEVPVFLIRHAQRRRAQQARGVQH